MVCIWKPSPFYWSYEQEALFIFCFKSIYFDTKNLIFWGHAITDEPCPIVVYWASFSELKLTLQGRSKQFSFLLKPLHSMLYKMPRIWENSKWLGQRRERVLDNAFFFSFLINLFIFILWLCWVFVSVRGLSPVVASGGHSSSRCTGLSLSRPLLLRSTSSRRAGSVIVAHGPSCSAACGILPDQGSNPCPLHWQADSQPLRHQGSPRQCLCLLNLTGSDSE